MLGSHTLHSSQPGATEDPQALPPGPDAAENVMKQPLTCSDRCQALCQKHKMLLVAFTDEQTDWKEGGEGGGLDLSSWSVKYRRGVAQCCLSVAEI